MLMPKATMNKQGAPKFGQNKVWVARVLSVSSKPESLTVQEGPDTELWRRVPVRDSAHHSASYFWCHLVSHSCIITYVEEEIYVDSKRS
jgi:hypothetical protein